MAKSGFWLKGAKGKFAGATIYDANGQSVMREVKTHIKNPRTKAQLIQRIISKTVSNQYSAMKGICDHSFEGVKPGADTMARFRSVNNIILRERIAKAQQEGDAFSEIYNFIPLKTNKFIPVSVQLSEGSLPRIGNVMTSEGPGFNILSTNNTYEGVVNGLSLERGDQLTFVAVYADARNNYSFKFARVILDPRESDGTAAPMSTAFAGENGAIVKPSFRNEGEINIEEVAGGYQWELADTTCVACAIIASRKVNNSWLRSTEILGIRPNDILGDDNISLQQALDLAIQGTTIYTDNERFLNNAGVGGPQEETPTPPEP